MQLLRRDIIKPSLRFSFFYVFFVSKSNVLFYFIFIYFFFICGICVILFLISSSFLCLGRAVLRDCSI